MAGKINTGVVLDVLSLEDSIIDFEIICKKLINAGYRLNISRVETESEFVSSIRSNKFDIILADFRLPGFDAFGALQLCNEICPDIPFICVSGTVGEETAIDLLKLGAVDYVLKDRLERLPFAIQRALNEATEKETRRKAEESLQKSEERFRHISNTISDISYSCKISKNGISLLDWMTGGAEKITGYSIEEIKDKHCWGKLVVKEDMPIFQCKVINLAPGSSDTCELRLHHKNGSIVWVNSFAECVKESGSSDCNRIFGGLIDITERKQIEKKIIQSNERYRQLFENSGTGVVIIDEEGNYMLANKIAAANLGKSPKEVIGKSMFDFLTLEQANYYLEFNRQLIKIGGGREYEDSYTLPGGKKYFLVVDQCIKDENGRNFAIQSSSLEITDRKEAENRLRESEVKFRSLFENSIMGISQALADGHLIYANDAYAKMYGYENSEEIISKVFNVEQLYANPEDRKKVIKILAAQGVMTPREMVVKRRDGTRIYVLVSAREIRDSEGNFLYYQAEHVDITERKRAEEALKNSEMRFRSIVENTEAGYFFIDKEGIIRDVNAAWAKLYHYNSIEEILGKHFVEIQKINDLDQAKEFVDGIMRNDSQYLSGEFSRKCKDGTIGYHTFSAKPVFRDGQIIGIEGFIIDSTESRISSGKLQESEKHFHSLFNNMAEGVALHSVVFDENGDPINYRIVDVNKKFEQIIGASKEDIIGKLATEAYGTDDPPYGIEYFQVALQLKPYSFDTYFPPLQKYFSISVVPWETNGFATIFQDITERKQSVEVLRESEEKYRDMVEQINDVIFSTDTNGIFTYISPTVEIMGGYKQEDMIGHSMGEFLDPLFIPLIKEQFQNVMAGKLEPAEYRVRTKSGELKWMRSSSRPIIKENRPVGMRGVLTDITERKQAEKVLRESETKFRVMFESSRDAINVSINGIQQYTNSAFLRLYGYDSFEEVVGTPILNHIAPSHHQQIMENIQRRANGEQSPTFYEIRGRKKDGTEFDEEVNVSTYELNGEIYSLGIIRDITERKRVEEEVRKSQQLLQKTLSSLLDAVFIIDADTVKIIDCNPAASAIFGYTREEMMGKTTTFLHVDQAAQVEFRLYLNSAVEEKGFLFLPDYLMRRKDTSKFPTEHTVIPILDEKGKHTSWVSIVRDITERKQAEVALWESQERFRTAFEYAPVGVSLVKIDGSFLQVNIALCKMLGYSKEELLSKNFYDISHPDDRELSKKMVEETLNSQGLLQGLEKRYIRKDGKTIWVEISSSLLRDDKKQPCYFIAQTVDITERKRTEEELIKAKEKAEESERLKTAFLHNISHEIRTPVNSIVGFADLLNEPKLQVENRKQFTDIIIQSSNHLLSIITDIVNIATIEAGQAKINKTKFNLNKTLQLIHEQFFLKAKKLNIDLNLQPYFKDNDDIILTDETKLVQIMSNLIGNALKFISKGYINFGYNIIGETQGLASPQDIASLQFFVEDTGIGIPPEMQEDIFTRFRQVENAATRQFGGSGLGLSISKAYVELLDGKMWVESKVGKGSTFYFTIPYVNGEK